MATTSRPEWKASGGQVIGSTATERRVRGAGSGSPVNTCHQRNAASAQTEAIGCLSTVDGAEVAVWADGAFCWWQVFTADTLGGQRRRRGVAVEPMTCPPDAFNSKRDLVILEPGQTWRGTWGIRAKLG